MKSNREPKLTIGEMLRDLRVERNWRQEDVAKMLSCAKSTISAYERDASSPNADVLIAYCNLFGVSADRILGLQQNDKVLTMAQMMAQIDSFDKNDCMVFLGQFLEQFNVVYSRLKALDQDYKKYRVRTENLRKADSR